MTAPLILIHGAWQGSWTFDLLLPQLEKAGVEAVAIDLAGNGFDTTPPEEVNLDLYLTQIEDVIDELGGSAVLVGHSGAGIIATAAAERYPDKTTAVIFLAGMCLPTGMDFGELTEQVVGEGNVFGITGDIMVSEDGLTSTVPVDRAAENFLNDVPKEIALKAAEKLTPQPEGGRFITSPTSPENFGRVPKLYIEALQDLSMILDAQRAMQAFIPDMPVVSMDCGHVPQFSDPEGLTKILVEFLDEL